MPRVALITTSYPAFPGDPCGHFVETEARLLARGGEVVVITAAAGAQAGVHTDAGRPRADDAGVVVWRLHGGDAFGWPGLAARVRERPSRLASVLLWARRARAVVRSLPPFDRVVAHWAIPSALVVAPARARTLAPRIPLEIVSHGADVRLLVRLPAVVRHALVDRLLRDAARWRFVSTSLHDELSQSLRPRDSARLARVACVAPCAIEIPDVRARSAELRAAQGGVRLTVLVGRLVADKGFDRALEAIARHRDGGAMRASRVVVVGDGPERARLEALSRALAVDARFVGRTSRGEALAWIGAADALVHASRAEGLSTVVREAEALGVPVEVVP